MEKKSHGVWCSTNCTQVNISACFRYSFVRLFFVCGYDLVVIRRIAAGAWCVYACVCSRSVKVFF